MQEILTNILNQAVWAPSAENCQPWKFRIDGNQVYIYNLPDRDIHTWGQRASYFANGALIENISIIAQHLGYNQEISLFPEPKEPELVATIIFNKQPTQAKPNGLYNFIKTRTTNRKAYQNIALTETQINEFSALPLQNGCQLILETNKNKKDELAQAVSAFEKILFGNKDSHAFFFEHITWNEAEEKEKSIGFFIKTLELPPPAKVLFPLIKHWQIMKILNKLNFPNAISKENSKVYSASAAVGAIAIENNGKESFVNAGRDMQKFWLTATKQGLQLQPLAGLSFLMLKVLFGDSGRMLESEIKIAKKAYNEMKKTLGLNEHQLIASAFRLGVGDPPSAKSSRLPIIIVP